MCNFFICLGSSDAACPGDCTEPLPSPQWVQAGMRPGPHSPLHHSVFLSHGLHQSHPLLTENEPKPSLDLSLGCPELVGLARRCGGGAGRGQGGASLGPGRILLSLTVLSDLPHLDPAA